MPFQLQSHDLGHPEQGTTLSLVTHGPWKPLKLTIPSLFPSPSTASSSSIPWPAQLFSHPRARAPRTRDPRTRQRRKWEEAMGWRAGSLECLLGNKKQQQRVGVTLTAMLCSEAGDEQVSERGRAVRVRARAASPTAPALPLAGAARVPMQMRPGRAGPGLCSASWVWPSWPLAPPALRAQDWPHLPRCNQQCQPGIPMHREHQLSGRRESKIS